MDWQMKPLGDLCRIELGSTPARKTATMWDPDRKTENVWLSIADLPQNLHAVATDSKEYVSDLAVKRMRLIPKGTLLVSFKLTLGRLAYAGRDLFSNEAIASLLDIDERQISKNFLYWALTAFDWEKAAEGDHKIKGKTLNKAKLKKILIPLPPLEEQHRIVAVLDEAFEGLARARAHAEANLQNTRELFENSLEAELEAVGSSNGTSLGEHIDLLAGFAFKSKGYTDDQSAMRLMRGDNIVPGAVRWEGAKYWPIDDCEAYEKFKLRVDDVLIAMDRTWIKAGIKYAVLSDEDVPSLLVQRVARLRCLASLDTHFLAMLIGSKSFERYVLSIQTGTGVPHISPTQIRDFKFPLPDIDKQAKIVERLLIVKNGSSELSEAYSQKMQNLDDLRQSLLQKAFAGELTRREAA